MSAKQELDVALVFKAMGDRTRLQILQRLAASQLCACNLLEDFTITQPTLSYHMKILSECGLVIGVRDGAWMKYSLNRATLEIVKGVVDQLESAK